MGALWRKAVTKEEIIAAVQKCAVKLERTPRLEDLRTAANINSYKVRMRFGNYMRLLAEAGLDATGMGHPVEQRALFLDWAGIVRKMKKIPTIVQYEQQSKYSVRPLAGRYQGWRKVAAGMRDYVIENHLEVEWDDVMKVITEHLNPAAKNSMFRRLRVRFPNHRLWLANLSMAHRYWIDPWRTHLPMKMECFLFLGAWRGNWGFLSCIFNQDFRIAKR
jgi:hypothetical protein